MSRRVKARPLSEDEVRNFPELFTSMFHDTLALMRFLRRLDYPLHRGRPKFMERRALKLRRALIVDAVVNTPAEALQLAELTPDEKKLTDRKFYKWAVEHSPLRLRQIEPRLHGHPSAERIICERVWDTPGMPWERWRRKDSDVAVPILPVEVQQHHASA